jgi:hypothetical protein
MVAGKIVEGSPREIAEQISKMVGDRRVKVMLMEEAGVTTAESISDEDFFRILAEIESDAMSVPPLDDSREGIYMRDDE